MERAPRPVDEAERLAALARYALLDSPREAEFDRITALACVVADAPIALMTLVDRDCVWLKSNCGLPGVLPAARDGSLCGHAILQPGPTEVTDLSRDERFADNPLVTGPTGVRFYFGVPLVVAEGRAIGTLCVLDRKPRQLNSTQKDSVVNLAQVLVALIEARNDRRRLEAALDPGSGTDPDLQHANEMLRSLNARINEGIETERRRIAQSLHDQAGQDLAALRMLAHSLISQDERARDPAAVGAQMKRVIADADAALHAVIADLRPAELDLLGLDAAARSLIRRCEQTSGLAVDLTIGGDWTGIGEPESTALYRMLQECLTNVVKHSDATEARVQLLSDDGLWRLVVEDNGRGFDTRTTPAPDSFGLAGIRERAAACGGSVVVDAAPGRGTRIDIALPAHGARIAEVA
jgi:signal transduction histidine kinase